MAWWIPRSIGGSFIPIIAPATRGWRDTSPKAVHAAYQRRPDVEVQLRLARPELAVVSDIAALAGQVRDWCGADRG